MRRSVIVLIASVTLLTVLMPPAWALNEVAIHEIQYTTDPSGDSPQVGRTITTGGVVTARFADGYVLQEPMSGPWTGIFVADTINHPPLGSFAVLSAVVAEQAGLTVLHSVESLTVINIGNALPQPVIIRAPDIAIGSPTAEQFEGVLVSMGKSAIAAVDAANNTWDIRDSTGLSASVGNRAGYSYVPQVGNDLAALHGVVFFTNGIYRIEPRNDRDILPIAPRPSVTGMVNLERAGLHDGVVVEMSGLASPAVTKSDGSYTIEAVPPGTYTIRAFAPGYLTAERQGVQILPGHTIQLPPLTLAGGDANGDNRINIMDLTIVASNFGQCPPSDLWADITKDGCVNLSDLVLVGQNFGRLGPTPW